MPVQWFKLQTPVMSFNRDPRVLIYNKDHDIYTEVDGNAAISLIDGLGMQQQGDKVYVRGVIKNRELHVDKDTLTREDKGW